MKKVVLLILAVIMTGISNAQKTFRLNHFVDSVLTKRYWRANIDTGYVTRPTTKWTLTGRMNVSGARITAEGRQPHHFESKLQADYKATLSVGVSYLGLSLNLSLNPAKLSGKYNDYEIGFRSYGKRFGYEITYQDARNFKGWQEVDGERRDITTSDDMFRLRTLNANAYYVFNSRRFSYPAAFSHSYIQRRSAGSVLLALSGQGQHGEVNHDTQIKFKMTNIGIGAGYGYNYVPAQSWLLHISALPTFIVYTNTSITMDDTEVPLHYHFPEVIITGRGAIVKQIGRNKFAGFSMVYHFTGIGHKDDLSVHNEKWLTRLYFGFRL